MLSPWSSSSSSSVTNSQLWPVKWSDANLPSNCPTRSPLGYPHTSPHSAKTHTWGRHEKRGREMMLEREGEIAGGVHVTPNWLLIHEPPPASQYCVCTRPWKSSKHSELRMHVKFWTGHKEKAKVRTLVWKWYSMKRSSFSAPWSYSIIHLFIHS